ncbi:alpha/beta hydrolase, partial [Erysipelatoclostridium ramosum]|nr:alpha/beta hydrolase [Thomasclavelia ramosa]
MEEQNTNIQLSLNDQGQIQGLFFKPYKSQKKAAKAPEGVRESEVDLQIADGKKLNGRLTTPVKGDSFPLVILLAGSGANDMDETIYDNKPL